jgi:hypothetical protein
VNARCWLFNWLTYAALRADFTFIRALLETALFVPLSLPTPSPYEASGTPRSCTIQREAL